MYYIPPDAFFDVVSTSRSLFCPFATIFKILQKANRYYRTQKKPKSVGQQLL